MTTLTTLHITGKLKSGNLNMCTKFIHTEQSNYFLWYFPLLRLGNCLHIFSDGVNNWLE